MTVLAEVRVPATEFVLAATLTARPRVRIEIKRVVAGSERVTPYFWAFGEDLDAFESELRADPDTVEVFTLDEERPDERFFRVTWHHDVPAILAGISAADATVLEAVNDEGGEWELKVLLPTRAALAHCRDYCLEHDVAFDLQRVYQPEHDPERVRYGLSEKQQAALEAAYAHGYFEIPRGATLTEIADHLGLSRNALSARLRRGHRNVLANTIVREERP